jgi:hypothetical protein
MAILMIGSFPAEAVACSCIPSEDLSPRQIAASVRQYPVIVKATVVRTEYPAVCRIAPLRWYAALTGDRSAMVKHVLSVKTVFSGKVGRRLVVADDQWVTYRGCYAAGSAACGIDTKPGPDLWVLRTSPDKMFRRADLCTNYVILDRLANAGHPAP